MTATSTTPYPAPCTPATAAFRSDLQHLAMDCGAKAQGCQERGQLTSAAKPRWRNISRRAMNACWC